MAIPQLLKIDPTLKENQVVYRTVDFFSAAAIVTNRQLMFSRADTFSDKNEGVGRLLAQLEISRPKSGCWMGWNNDATARAQHERVKRSCYLSCWSLNPESVAMWSLYSPDCCSVRISTTISRLRFAIEHLLDKYSYARLSVSDLGNPVAVSVEGQIAPVAYASLTQILQRVTRRAKAHSRLAARYELKGQSMPTFLDVDPRYWQRQEQRRLKELEAKINLKDISFQHEAEVRLSVRLGEEIFGDSWLEAFRRIDTGEFNYPSDILSAWGNISQQLLPKYEFVNCPHDLVETVAIDPRCPDHKAEFMRKWFRDNGIRIVESSCFGYIPDSFDVYPES